MRRAFGLATAVAAVTLLTGLPADAAGNESVTRVAIVTNTGNVFVKTLGGGETSISDEGDVDSATWSPDGASLAITRGGQIEIRRGADLGTVERVPGVTGASHASWSGDGQSLVFARSVDGGQTSIWSVQLDGSGLRQLAKPGRCSASGFSLPQLSADGRFLVYVNSHRWSDPDCRGRLRGATIRSLDDGARIPVRGYPLGRPGFTSDSSAVMLIDVTGGGQQQMQVSSSTGDVTYGVGLACVEGDGCWITSSVGRDGRQTTIYESAGAPWSNGGRTCLSVGDEADCYVDPDYEVDGDEYGYPWGRAWGWKWIDTSPTVAPS